MPAYVSVHACNNTVYVLYCTVYAVLYCVYLCSVHISGKRMRMRAPASACLRVLMCTHVGQVGVESVGQGTSGSLLCALRHVP